MEKHVEIDKLRTIVEETISGFPDIGLVYLFGSRVESNQGPLSDYDLGFHVDKKIPSELKIKADFSHGLACKLHTDMIDVVILNRAPIELSFNVISEGKILFERDVYTRVEFESHIMSMYLDYLPILRKAKREILEGKDYEARVHRYRKAFGRTQGTLSQIRAAKEQTAL